MTEFTPDTVYLNRDQRNVHVWASDLGPNGHVCLVAGALAVHKTSQKILIGFAKDVKPKTHSHSLNSIPGWTC